jgi:glycosyltransferase involved in cell wall biosynthesis
VVFEIIVSRKVEKVFIDGSNLGQLVKLLARRFPVVQLIVFFHNVEARFFWGAFKRSKSVHALAVLAANYLAERKAVRHAHKIVCLSIRDSRVLSVLYGRSATHVSAMALRDSLPRQYGESPDRNEEVFLLFVGGNFYANRDGIAWFVDHVVPRISIKTVVVGNGLEAMKDRLELKGNVVVVGAVDSLAGWYRDAHVVVAPIFDGSGMKTKVAEALMFGKRVIGAPEAFSGYEDALPAAGEICCTADEFVAALNRSLDAPFCAKDEQLRSIYERHYSYAAARQRLEQILEV